MLCRYTKHSISKIDFENFGCLPRSQPANASYYTLFRRTIERDYLSFILNLLDKNWALGRRNERARRHAIGAGARATIGHGGRDPIARPRVGFHFQRFAHAQNQSFALDAEPIGVVGGVAVQSRNLPVRGHFDPIRVGETRQDFARSRVLCDVRLVINRMDVEQMFGQRNRRGGRRGCIVGKKRKIHGV